MVGIYEPHYDLKDFMHQSQFSAGGFNCLNKRFQGQVINNVYGIDQRSAYD
jgi:hypothetical protein